MARLTFPDEGSRSAFRTAPSGRPLTSAAGAAALVYLDAGATTLADIQTTAGVAIAGSSLNLDAYSRFPLFLGPADGTDTLYVVVDGGPVSPMYARVDDRIDAVKATADAAETPAGAAAKVSAEATTRAAADSAEATARAAAVTAAQAAAVQRSNHTGTQLAATISDLPAAALAATAGAYVASADGVNFTWNGSPVTGFGGGAAALTPTAVKTANYTAAAGDLVPVDTTSGAVTVTLPTAPADKTQVGIKHILQGGTNVVTVACGGSAVLNRTGGATSFTMPLLAQAAILQYKASSGIWYVTTDDLPLSQLDGRYVALAPAGGAQALASGQRVRLRAAGLIAALEHSADLTDQLPLDVLDITNNGTGDGVYVYMLGGRKPGYAGTVGDSGGVTVTIPAKRDGSGDYDGTVTNDRTGASALKAGVYSNSAGAVGLYVYSHSDGPAVSIENQPSVGQPIGNGRAVQISDRTTNDTLWVNRITAPTETGGVTDPSSGTGTKNAVITIADQSSVAGATPVSILRVKDTNGTRFSIDTLGVHRWAGNVQTTFDTSIRRKAVGLLGVTPAIDFEDGPAGVGTPSNGIQKVNNANVLGFYTQGSLVFEIRNGTRIGFYGLQSGPTKQTITGSRGSNAALASLLTALAALGLLTDSSTA